MKRAIFLACLATLATACASTGMGQGEKLALYRSHAGPPVSSFQYFGSIHGWTPLGDSAIAVWTKPNEAWLLDLYGPCPDIEYTPVIGVSSQMGRVNAKFDKVIARNRGTMEIPCNIKEIRPLDAKAIKQAEKTAREEAAAQPASGT